MSKFGANKFVGFGANGLPVRERDITDEEQLAIIFESNAEDMAVEDMFLNREEK